MGVRGLSTYVDENCRRFYERKKLNNCSIVIDGYGILYYLYYSCEIDSRLGGEYEVLVSVIRKFFNQLKQCEITSHVIFDGPLSEDKVSCTVQRMRDKVREVCTMFNTGQLSEGRRKHLPLFAIDVFQHTLNELHIPYMISLNDADSEIAAFANHAGCYVLAQDSDFFIYNLQHGYLPLMHFFWEEIFKDGHHPPHIVCQSYDIKSMIRQFDINESALPWLSILLGNDWINQDIFKQFVLKLLTKKSQPSKKKKKKARGKVEIVLAWLSTQYQSDSQMINKLQQNKSKQYKEIEIPKIHKCLDLYRMLPNMSEHAKLLMPTQPDLREEGNHEISPARADDSVRTGSLPPLVCDVKNLQLVLLPVIPSDPRKPSPHLSAQKIRSVIYEVILRKYSDSQEATMILEYDRVGPTYKRSRCIEPVVTICPVCQKKNEELPCQCLAKIANKNEVFDSVIKRLLEIEDINLKQWCDKLMSSVCVVDVKDWVDFEVLLLSILYWVRCSTPAPSVVCALAIVIAWSIYSHSSNCSKEELKEDSSENYLSPNQKSQVKTCKEKGTQTSMNKESKKSHNSSYSAVELLDAISPTSVSAAGYREYYDNNVNMELLHSASEWQCILQSILMLKKIIQPGKPLFAAHGVLNSNTLLQKVFARIKKEMRHQMKRNPKSLHLLCTHLAGNIQVLNHKMTSLFRVFIDFLSQHAQQKNSITLSQ